MKNAKQVAFSIYFQHPVAETQNAKNIMLNLDFN